MARSLLHNLRILALAMVLGNIYNWKMNVAFVTEEHDIYN